MNRLLVQTQLSNYTPAGTSILECDSGWNMCMGRIREMLKLSPELVIDVMGPTRAQLKTQPEEITPGLFGDRLTYVPHKIIPNALATRYDFDLVQLSSLLQPKVNKYTHVLINDPMLFRNFKALFFLYGGYQPKFYVHSHFVDVPEVPKFPQECSLWLGQCEAALRADYNFWQCESAMLQFFDSMGKWFTQDVVDDVRAKSLPWDDGYSVSEIRAPVDMTKVRFTQEEWDAKTRGKKVIFFPNRISPSSGDYTNGMKFMFELLPRLRQLRNDFVVVCGNPNQKFSNKDLEEKCGQYGYVSLAPDTFNRDEYKFVASRSHVTLSLYNADAYGGTAARECIELGCMPLWLDNYEYSSIAREAGVGRYVLVDPNFSNLVEKLDRAIGRVACPSRTETVEHIVKQLQHVVRTRCSFEVTTPAAMRRMGLL